MPNTIRASPRAVADRASAGSSRASDSHAAPATVTRALPNRLHSAPVSVIVAIAPADAPSSATPREAGEAPIAAFTAGMRTAQLANTKPSMPKNAVMAMRSRVASLRAAAGTGSLYSNCTKHRIEVNRNADNRVELNAPAPGDGPAQSGPATLAGPPTLAGTALMLIHTGQAPTRSALTGRLGVTRGTTGAITGELRDGGLIVVDAGPPAGDQPGGQGRPSHRLLPDPRGPGALAAQVHPDGYEVVLVGLGGIVVARLGRDTPVPADPGRALAPVAGAAAALLRDSGRRCVRAAVAEPTAASLTGGF